MQFLGVHLLLPVQQAINVRLFDFSFRVALLALYRERGEILAQVFLGYFFGRAMRNTVHEVFDLSETNFFIASHHRASIRSFACQNFSFFLDLLERLYTGHLEEVVDFLLSDLVAIDAKREVCSEKSSSSFGTIAFGHIPCWTLTARPASHLSLIY